MSRFREEHYATKAWKAAFTPGGTRKKPDLEADERTRRSEYFKKPLAVRKAIYKAQKAQGRMNGF